MRYLILLSLTLAALLVPRWPAQNAQAQTPAPDANPSYVLGPNDQLTFSVTNLADEFTDKTFRIDFNGNINVPLAGRIHAAGLTVEEFEGQVGQRLVRYVKDPEVVVSVSEFNSQPVSVLGAVNSAGIKQVTGRKTLFEVLSLAGGLRPDAGNTIMITRSLEHGPIPLPDVTTDATGQFSVGSVSVKTILNATDPVKNIVILPGDIISVSKAVFGMSQNLLFSILSVSISWGALVGSLLSGEAAHGFGGPHFYLQPKLTPSPKMGVASAGATVG